MKPFRQLVNEASRVLADAGVASPQHDAQALLEFVLGQPFSAFYTVHAEDIAAFNELIARRAAREPLQHITGIGYFRHLELNVGPGVFSPRPETELLAQAGIDALKNIDGERIAIDLCSGSGAIAISMATEVPHTRVIAVELSADAVVWLEKNVEKYSAQLAAVNSSVDVKHADAADLANVSDVIGQTHVVLSNPPYIPDAMVPREVEVVKHDPHMALFGGEDGLDVVRNILEVAASALVPNGLFGIEHADVQGDDVSGVPSVLIADGRWAEVKDHRDYNDLPRFTTAHLKG